MTCNPRPDSTWPASSRAWLPPVTLSWSKNGISQAVAISQRRCGDRRLSPCMHLGKSLHLNPVRDLDLGSFADCSGAAGSFKLKRRPVYATAAGSELRPVLNESEPVAGGM